MANGQQRDFFDDYDGYDDEKPQAEEQDTYDSETGDEEKEKPERPEVPPRSDLEDNEIEELVVVRPRDKYMHYILGGIVGTILLLIFGCLFVFNYPVVDEAQVRGSVLSFQCEGLVFKTFEGKMVSELHVNDTIVVLEKGDFSFSVENDSVAAVLMKNQNRGRTATLTYKRYISPLPWRGSENIIVYGVKFD